MGGSRALDVWSPHAQEARPARARRAGEPSFCSDDGVRAEAYASKDDAAQTITISTPAELGLLAHEVNEGNTYAGWTVRLDADIDLSGHVWDPIGQEGGRVRAGIARVRGSVRRAGSHDFAHVDHV